ncbi:MAG: hotdog fold thioesterase [Candidatus Lokiarchaeota archaeon]|nr:hotdog fold thioesterase [Candidatus Lokiarchaeota archaeon]
MIVKNANILKHLTSAIGNNLPDLHKIPMITSKYNGKLISVSRGEIRVQFLIQPQMTNPLGILHGGMQCTLIDDIIGIAVATLGNDVFSMSINLQINYLGKAKLGEKIYISARIIREGRNIIHASAKISDINDKIISVAQSDLLKTQIDSDYIQSLLNEKQDK